MGDVDSAKVIGASIIAAALILAFANRYEVSAMQRGAFVLNKLTGPVWICGGGPCRKTD